MATRRRAERLLCINCNICVNTLGRYPVVQLDTRVVSLISNRVSPFMITDEDYICEACFNLFMQAANAQIHANDDQSAGSSLRGHLEVCLMCGRSLINRQSDLILKENPTVLIQAMIQIIETRIAPRQISPCDRVCHACWLKTKRDASRRQELNEVGRVDNYVQETESLHNLDNVPTNPNTMNNQPLNTQELQAVQQYSDESNTDHGESPHAIQNQPGSQVHQVTGTITLPNYKRAPNTASHCIFIGCDNTNNLHTVSDYLRATLIHSYKFYIPPLARVCIAHLQNNIWDSLYDSDNSMSTFTANQVEHVFSLVNAFKPFLDFSSLNAVQEMDDHLFWYWMGITKDNFLSLIEEVPRILAMKKGILGLASVLIKMRTGDSDQRISILLDIPRTTLERIMTKVREILLQDFVNTYLGINALPRSELIGHNLMIPSGIYNESQSQAIVICDGTYIYLNKSSNYMFQKDSYSLHKYKNLLKPFLIVACDGYILDCLGPYKATASDADIMISLFNNENSSLRRYFQENDIFILDRGFRDSVSLLESCNYKVYMPESLLEGEHQLTTDQANRSRCVTICRWVVEVVNGYFKRDYRLLRFDHFNKTVPNMMSYFQIAASLLNKFGVRLHDRTDAAEIINIIRERLPLDNNLSRIVGDLNLNRRSSYFRNMTVNADSVLFPRLEYNDLISLSLGTYQIRQARSYYGEHVRFHGGYRIEVCTQAFDATEFNLESNVEYSLLKGRIKSRHVNRRQYYVYILLKNNTNGREAIHEYCCSCIVGRRTVGCCAHVMTVVWYLGWARYQDNIVPPAAFLDNVVVREDIE